MKDKVYIEGVLDLSSKIKHAESTALAAKKELDEMFDKAFGDRKITILLGNNKDIQYPTIK